MRNEIEQPAYRFIEYAANLAGLGWLLREKESALLLSIAAVALACCLFGFYLYRGMVSAGAFFCVVLIGNLWARPAWGGLSGHNPAGPRDQGTRPPVQPRDTAADPFGDLYGHPGPCAKVGHLLLHRQRRLLHLQQGQVHRCPDGAPQCTQEHRREHHLSRGLQLHPDADRHDHPRLRGQGIQHAALPARQAPQRRHLPALAI